MADNTTLPQSITDNLTALEAAIKTGGSAASAVATNTAIAGLTTQVNNAVSNTSLASTLKGYATTDSLSAFAKESELANYAKQSDLSVFAKTTDLANYAKTTDVSTQLTNYNTQWAQDNAAFKQDVLNTLKNVPDAGTVNKNTDDIKNLPSTLEASFKDKFLSTEGNAAFGDKVCVFQTTSNITHINGQGKLNGGITSSNFDQWNPVGFTLGNNIPVDIRNLTNITTSTGGTDYSVIYGNEGGGGCNNFLTNTPGFAGVTPTTDFYIGATDGSIQNPFFRFNIYTEGNGTENPAISGNNYGFWYQNAPCPAYQSNVTVSRAPTFFEQKSVSITDGQTITFPTPFESGASVSVYTQLLNTGTPTPAFVSVVSAGVSGQTSESTTGVTFSVTGVDGKPYSGSVTISFMAVATL